MRWRYEGDSVGSGMLEVFLGVSIGVVLVSVAIIWWRLERNAFIIQHALESSSRDVKLSMDSATLPDIPTLEDFREEIQDIIQDTIGSMRTPQMADHLGAILQQWAQVKMHKEMAALQQAGKMIENSPIGEAVDEMMS